MVGPTPRVAVGRLEHWAFRTWPSEEDDPIPAWIVAAPQRPQKSSCRDGEAHAEIRRGGEHLAVMTRIAGDHKRSPSAAIALLQVDAPLDRLKVIEARLRLNDPVEVIPYQVPVQSP